MIRLLEVIKATSHDKILAHNFGAVAAGKDHFKVGPLDPEALGQFAAVHAVGHDQVGQNQVDLVFVLVPDVEGFAAGFGLKDFVAVTGQKVANQFANRGFVL